MISRIALLIALVGIQLVSGDAVKLTSIKARWAVIPFQGFYSIPQTLKTSGINDYVRVTSGFPPLAIDATLYCRPNDPRICWMYDRQGKCAGVQVSFLVNDVKNVKGYDYSDSGSYERTNIFGVAAYSTRAYFFNPATGRKSNSEVADGVWIKAQGQLVEMPRWDPAAREKNGWNKQACFPAMGMHYFYKMNSGVRDCTKFTPFGLYHDGSLVGFGIPGYGKASVANGGRNWYESVPLLGVKVCSTLLFTYRRLIDL